MEAVTAVADLDMEEVATAVADSVVTEEAATAVVDSEVVMADILEVIRSPVEATGMAA
jgi:tRNA threonylcarbamoyladenosine modification (KEOPS) complex  Pcc1 subunit